MRVAVSLCHTNHHQIRQIKKTASAAKNWNPKSDCIQIRFQPLGEGVGPVSAREPVVNPPRSKASAGDQQADPVRDLIHALKRAEGDPKLRFVALKWFRDKFLPEQGFGWTVSDPARQHAIVQAIEKNWVLTSRIPNPNYPQYPTTTIRLNGLHPDVTQILKSGAVAADEFDPMAISGEPLSETVLRDRR